MIDTTQSDVCFPTNLIVAEIDQKPAPHLCFEWLYFTDAKETPRLHERFPSKSRPINIAACSKRLDYDSIGSQLLVRFLTNAGYLEIINGRVSLNADYLQGLAEYAALAEKIQQEALEIADATEGDEEKKKGAGRVHISNFVRNAAGYDATAKDFVVDPLFHYLAETVVDYPNPRIEEGVDTGS